MSEEIDLRTASPILGAMVRVIVANADRLNTLDGAIGDGDHGVNMSKGFRLAGEKLKGQGSFDLGEGMAVLGDTLLSDIGGSMGPLYGTFFTDMAETLQGADGLDSARCATMLHAGLDAICGLGDAKVGDKTLVDVLAPATAAFDDAAGQSKDFASCLRARQPAADAGCEAPRDMVAKLGRAARLGERSRGFLDAGAVSCCLLLNTLADGLLARLESGERA